VPTTDVELTHEAKAEIVELLYRYATALDERDWGMFATIWTDDLETDYQDIGTWSGVEPFAAFMEKIHDRCGESMHRITNPVVWVEGGEVRARSYIDGIVLMATGTEAMRAIGRYEDVLRETGDGWRTASRRFRALYMKVRPLDEAI
jgi:3-phenylpropionate/cinnamic acid dioxygenase small subunit